MVENKDIEKSVLEWTSKHIKIKDFKFRENQLSEITDIVSTVVDNKAETKFIEAPTGSGKSIICIVSAGVLSDCYDMTSYILCSDLYLWHQYEEFIFQNDLDFGTLKGITGNYTCTENNQDLLCGSCKIAGISYSQLKNEKFINDFGWECSKSCEYMLNRFHAEEAKVTLMTYQLWLYQMNVVNSRADSNAQITFNERDVVFCDECHKVPDIIQGFCTPAVLPSRDFTKMMDIFQYADKNSLMVSKEHSDERDFIGNVYNERDFHNSLMDIYREMCNEDNTQERDYELFKSLADQMKPLNEVADQIKEKAKSLMNKRKHVSKELMKILGDLGWLGNYNCYMTDFINAISSTGIDYLVKNISMSKKSAEKSIVFNCAKEDLLCNIYLNSHAKHKIMLSATIGGKDAFDDNIGIKFTKSKKSEMHRLGSTFDFSNSPIYYFPEYSLSFAKMDDNYPKICQIAYQIMQMHPNEKGIIHSGSYQNALRFLQNAPENVKSRILCYNDSHEKEELLERYQQSSNLVLVGPSIIEGLDMPDDLCRFIIILKVPYPSLKDNLVKAKIKLFPKWYSSTTANSIVQGIGRGIRNKHDWCQTYILDGSFSQLYNKTLSNFPKEFTERLKIVKL